MKFGIKDRIVLLGILPDRGNFLTLVTLDALRKELAFDPEEITKYKLAFSDGSARWEGGEDKEIEINDVARDLIVKGLKELDTKEQLTTDHVELYKEFVEQKED